jgi:transcriptional regulator
MANVQSSDARGEMLYGALDMLILKALQLEPMHGWGITERIRQRSDAVLEVNQGSLYPALYRLKRAGWITSEWRVTENNRRARYYRLTPAGRRAFSQDLESWKRFTVGLDAVLESTS